MGWSFRKSFTLFPGLRATVSKSGLSLSAGPRGARVSQSQQGTRVSLGIPGTGLRWTKKVGGAKRRRRR